MDGEMDYEGQYGRYVDNYDNTVEGSIWKIIIKYDL
jgi:hypothetical protein